MKRVLVVGVVLVTVLVAALTYRIRAQEEALHGPPRGAGVIEAGAVDVGSRLPGRIVRTSVREGAVVHAGDALVEIDCAEPRARLAEADARIEAARAQAAAAAATVETATRGRFAASAAAVAAEAQVGAVSAQETSVAREAARVQSLGDYASAQARDTLASQAEGVRHQVAAAQAQTRATRAQISVAGAQIEAARAQARAAQSSVTAMEAVREVARIAVEECVVRAPRDGVVENLYYEAGELVAPGAVVVRLVDLTDLRAVFYLPNAEVGEARLGRQAEIVADAWPGEVFAAEVITVATEAEFTPRNIQTRTDRDRLVYAIEVRAAADPRLRPGMPVEVTLR